MAKDLPNNWLETELDSIFNLFYGKGLPVKSFTEDGYNVYGANGIIGKYKDYNFEKEKIIISCRGAASGAIHKTKPKSFVTSNSIILDEISSEHLNIDFAKYAMINVDKESVITGTAQPQITVKLLKDLKFPLPPLAEQERIVAKLDSLFTRIDNIKGSLAKVPELLQNFRQQVLTQAVKGKLTEIWRDKVGIKRLDHREINKERQLEWESEITSLLKQGKRKQKLSEYSNRGYNSIGWAITNVESASLLIVDCLHNTPKFIIEGTNYVVDTTCIKPFRIDWNKARRIDDITYQEWTSRLEPREGDIIFSREGTIGIAVKVPKNKRVCIGQRTMIFRFGSYIIPRYAEILFNSQHFKNLYQPLIKGVASQHLNIRDIRKLEISIPSYTEQLKIVEIVDSLLKKADKMEDQFKISRKLIDNLPQSILQRAFKGELVPQLESDGDARDLLREIEGLKKSDSKQNKKIKDKPVTDKNLS